MKVIIFGASGMVGSGVLRECVLDARVTAILVIGRTTCGVVHPKLQEVLHADFFDFTAIQPRLADWDACFFCLGVSVAGLDEATYTHLTYDLTLAAARAVAAGSPRLTFCYVSGEGTDSTGQGRSMWARVKGKTENALLAMPFQKAYMFRPAYIQPVRGERSKTWWYQLIYSVVGSFYPLLRKVAPKYTTTTVEVARAMIAVAANGDSRRVLSSDDINRLAAN